jgi:hypothetical protein
MRRPQATAAVAAIAVLMSWPVYAADKVVVLDVKNADCVLCPPIVKQSLLRVKDVKTVEIRQADQMADFMAVVTFDDTAVITQTPAI